MRLADKFTLVRVVYAPVFLAFYLLAESPKSIIPWFREHSFGVLLVLAVILIFVEITDYLDGSVARKRGEVSDTGKLFDPFADALLHISTFFCFTSSGYMPAGLFMIIFYREFSMMFLRMMTIKNGVAIAARPGGKFKTVLYITAGFWTLAVSLYEKLKTFEALAGFSVPPDKYFRLAGVILFSLCALTALASFIDYIVHFTAAFRRKEK
jgi:CDP-diacylglycerol--glycerol-3-phosphate 3-phosphatidyltransferase